MSKQPVSPEAGGGVPPSRARGTDAAPSPSPPGTGRIRKASVQGERQAAAGSLRDGAGTSAAMAARAGDTRRVTLVTPTQDGGQPQVAQYQGEERTKVPQPKAAAPPRPSYVPAYQRRREQPPAYGPYPQGGGGIPEEQQAMPPTYGGRFPIATSTRASDMPDSSDVRRHPRRHQPTPGDEAARPGILTTPGGPAPRHGGNPTAPEGPSSRVRLPTAKTIERVSTFETGIGYDTEGAPPPGASSPSLPPHTHVARSQHPTPPPPPYGKKMLSAKENSKKLSAMLFTLCCILFWLLVVCIGLAILVIYLLYHPKPPRLHVSTATLNAGYIDELPPPHLGKALNSDLYVLAAIYNPNTKIDVVLRYMQFDLYFQGHLIGTQAVWPPLYERPGDSALRSVHLVVSEVVMPPEDADVWKNATASGGLMQMQLEGRFYVQLNFGRWLPFRYMVKPSCALWLDPPPAGALRRARCRQ
ncbi:hypothetical protein BAE44_0007943 [Dichanthelium oligosanthes]|uniref:Late embryogenesis abundant protein LEA-2 subgroup domain-containing protein n=1 Tax=Dichanthelium oligosanthes TaxID=888268 RepID=A0A1E5W0V9_9POAL|nr:hypothetical protein BAE44_0007943 [Dichanthelium oligosanthes]